MGGGVERALVVGGAARVSLEEGRRSRPLFHEDLAAGPPLLEEC